MFKEFLEAIIERTDGSIGALIMGTDGIAVEKVLNEAGEEANLDVAAAELTSLVRGAQRAGNELGLGGLRELVVSLDDLIVPPDRVEEENGARCRDHACATLRRAATVCQD